MPHHFHEFSYFTLTMYLGLFTKIDLELDMLAIHTIPEHRRLRREDLEFQGSLVYTLRPFFKQIGKKEREGRGDLDVWTVSH